MTLETQMSTNVVMPHPNDALLRHDDKRVKSLKGCAGSWLGLPRGFHANWRKLRASSDV